MDCLDKKLSKVEWGYKSHGGWIEALRFTFSDGSQSPIYGNKEYLRNSFVFP